MIINVAFDGRKLFDWEGEAKKATQIDQDVAHIAALSNESPRALWEETLVKIAANRGRFYSVEMMIVISGLLSMPTQNPDHPGRCRDYLETSNFYFDIKIDPENMKPLGVEVRASDAVH